jgi:hypothetical protein
MPSEQPRPIFFNFEQEYSDFNLSFARALHELNRKLVHNKIPEENTQRFNHGRSWSHVANAEIGDSELKSMSADMLVKFDDIIDGNLDIILRALAKIVDDFKKQFATAFYAMLSETCERSGNIVSAKNAGSFAAGFMEAIRNIEFGIDRDGNVSMPELHIGQDPQKILAELEAQPPEYHAEFERIKSEKIAAAIERERLRKDRFKRRD